MTNSSDSPNALDYRHHSYDLLSVAGGYFKFGPEEEEHLLRVWNTVQECTPSVCPVENLCKFRSKGKGKCAAIRTYLAQVYSDMLETNQRELDSARLHQIGLHLLPIYKTLVRLLMEELVVLRATTVSPKGTVGVHPIFKEIRSTVKLIDQLWRSIGLQAPPTGGLPLKDANPVDGEGYYEEMERKAKERLRNLSGGSSDD